MLKQGAKQEDACFRMVLADSRFKVPNYPSCDLHNMPSAAPRLHCACILHAIAGSAPNSRRTDWAWIEDKCGRGIVFLFTPAFEAPSRGCVAIVPRSQIEESLQDVQVM
eukprot:1159883-Pelagomonas_calceolata.AAC.13